MSGKYDFAAYFNFMGGQNSSSAPDNLLDIELQKVVNFDVVNRGAIKSRDGTVSHDWGFVETPLTDKPIKRLGELNKSDGSCVKFLLSDGKFYLKDNTTPLLTSVGDYMEYTVYHDKAYILMNSKYYEFDGSTIAEVTKSGVSDNNLDTIKACKYILAKGERLFASGNPAAPTALYYSQIGDPAYFKTGDFRAYANSGDGDRITGLHEYQSTLLVFKSQGIWKWEGASTSSDVTFTKLSAHSGTKHHRTIRDVENFVFYLGYDGVYIIKTTSVGVVATEKISQSIDDLFATIQDAQNWWEGTACGIYSKGKYILSFCNDATNPDENNRTVVCHVGAGAGQYMPWTPYTGVPFSDALFSTDGTLYLGDPVKQDVFKFQTLTFTDRGASIAYSLMTKDYNLGSPIHLKKCKLAWLVFRQYEQFESVVEMNMIVDYVRETLAKQYVDKTASEALVWNLGDWGINKWGWIDTVTLPFKVGMKGIRFRIELFAESTAEFNNDIYIYGIAYMYKTKKPYKAGAQSGTVVPPA